MSSIFSTIKKDLNLTQKRWAAKKYDRTLGDITEKWITFLQEGDARRCKCKRGRPKLEEISLPGGGRKVNVRCSECGGKFYKKADFSFVLLGIGRRGGGKTTFLFTFVDLIHRINPFRRIKIWQAPNNLVPIIHNLRLCKYYGVLCDMAMGEIEWEKNMPIFEDPDRPSKKDQYGNPIMYPYQANQEPFRVCSFEEFKDSESCKHCPHFQLGKNYYHRIERLEEVEYNDILIIDEGIISMNAKEALKKIMVDWEKLLAVLRHKRIILIVMFQRFQVIKAIRNMCDIFLYKNLPVRTVLSEKKDDPILTQFGKEVSSLDANEGILSSTFIEFEVDGYVFNHIPFWYSDEISMSYLAETEFLSHKSEYRKNLDFAEIMAQHLIDKGIEIDTVPKKNAARFMLKRDFQEHDPPPTDKQITDAFHAYSFLLLQGNAEIQTKQEENFVETMQNPELELILPHLSAHQISQRDWRVFLQYCMHNRKMHQFTDDPFNLTKQSVSEKIPKMGKFVIQLVLDLLQRLKYLKSSTQSYRKGEEGERQIVRETWKENGYALRSVGSGGDQYGIPSPDCLVISPHGRVHFAQIKERNLSIPTSFPALTFNTEFKGINRLRNIAKKTHIICKNCGERNYGVLKPGKAVVYVIDENSKKVVIKDYLEYSDNKKTLKVNASKHLLYRQQPDPKKIKNPKLQAFLKSTQNIYYSHQYPDPINSKDLEELTEDTDVFPYADLIDLKKQDEMINLSSLYAELGIE